MTDRMWYYSHGGQQKGPINTAQLKQLAANGQLQLADLVWTDQMENWAAASTVKGLFSSEGVAATAGGPPLADTLPGSQHADSPTGAYAQQFSSATQVAGAASREAAGAFKNMMADPWGRVGAAYEQLGPKRALIVGSVFLGVFAVCCIIAAIIKKAIGIPGAFEFVSIDAASFFKSLFVLIGYIAALIGVVALFRVLARTGVNFAADLFVVGSSLLPLGAYVLLVSLLDLTSGVIRWIAMVLLIFAATTSILMLYNGLIKAERLSDRMAGLAVPAVLGAAMSAAALLNWLFF